MSSASAWMPLYIGDYLGDTQRLTTEQHGAYLLLLMDYWRNGPPPADDAVLAQIVRMSPKAWVKTRSAVLRFFSERDGHLHHGRVDRELANARENQGRRSAKAKKAADARWHSSEDAPSNAQSMPEAMLEGCPPPSPSSEAKASGVPPPDPVKALFDLGVAILTGAGLADREARSMIGLWRKHHTDAATMEALLAARDKTDPVAWIQAKLGGQARENDELLASINRKYGT